MGFFIWRSNELFRKLYIRWRVRDRNTQAFEQDWCVQFPVGQSQGKERRSSAVLDQTHRDQKCHPHTDSTVTLQKVLDNKASQLPLRLWLCHMMMDGTLARNQTPEPQQSRFRVCFKLIWQQAHRLIHTVYSLTIRCIYCKTQLKSPVLMQR